MWVWCYLLFVQKLLFQHFNLTVVYINYWMFLQFSNTSEQWCCFLWKNFPSGINFSVKCPSRKIFLPTCWVTKTVYYKHNCSFQVEEQDNLYSNPEENLISVTFNIFELMGFYKTFCLLFNIENDVDTPLYLISRTYFNVKYT